MTISEYRLTQDFRAPKANVGNSEFQSSYSFRKGEMVQGYIDQSTGQKLLVTGRNDLLPMHVLKFVRDISRDGVPVDEDEETSGENSGGENGGQSEKPKTEAQKIEDKAKEIVKSGMAKEKIEIPAEYREQMEKIKNTDIVNSIVKKSRNSVNGLLIGGITGLVIAIATGKSKFMGAFLGATAGGLIGYGITGEAKKEVKKEKTPEKKPETNKSNENGKKD